MNVLFNNRDPVYLQVIRRFKEEIATGKRGAGEEIPSRRELASMFQINPNTVQRAYKEMEEQNLITTEGNSPSRITTDERIVMSIREELIREAVSDFVDRIMNIGVPVDELIAFVRAKYDLEDAHK